jgi:hypothetical protein
MAISSTTHISKCSRNTVRPPSGDPQFVFEADGAFYEIHHKVAELFCRPVLFFHHWLSYRFYDRPTGGQSVMMAFFGRFLLAFASFFGVSLTAHAAFRGHSPVTLVSTIVSAVPTVLGAINKYGGTLSKIFGWDKGEKRDDPQPPKPGPAPSTTLYPARGTYPIGAYWDAVWDDPNDYRCVIVQTHQLQVIDAYGNVRWMPVSPPVRRWR